MCLICALYVTLILIGIYIAGLLDIRLMKGLKETKCQLVDLLPCLRRNLKTTSQRVRKKSHSRLGGDLLVEFLLKF